MKLFRSTSVCFMVLWLLACGNKKIPLFAKISAAHSGITFNNTIVENDSLNPLTVVNIYNGGGVGIGDFNNDGLQDIYLTGNTVSSKLYLNKGKLAFADVTDKAGASGMGRWARGVAVVDINNDGLMDIYICNTIYKDSLRRTNILYINTGIDKEGVPHFKDMAAEYGLNINVQSTMASFFDFDNDGDLDMFLSVNEASMGENPSVFNRTSASTVPSISRLYRNDMDSTLKHSRFTDVSVAAGMKFEGFGHGATVCDINNDGWKDIYVADDFLTNDLLYINNHNGTFTNKAKEMFKHTSFNSMGQDVTDINNDGLPDVVALDMSPEDNYRKKVMMNANNYNTFQNFDAYGYLYQYVRNTLQVNQGPRLLENDSVGEPVFSEISFMSGIAQTDWSWTPLITDFDNDSYRDIVITNGFPRDVTDHDFVSFRKNAVVSGPTKTVLDQIPQVKLHNYAFQNKGDLSFNDVSADWGLSLPTFSNGAAFADFDNDGAIDMVINNINDEALLYRNTARDYDTINKHFIHVNFKGGNGNRNGLGALATIYYNHNQLQTYENNPYRGYLSSVQSGAHFGLGKITTVDSLVVQWNNGLRQTIKNLRADQVVSVSMADAKDICCLQKTLIDTSAVFKDVTGKRGIHFRHKAEDYIDFNVQMLLPHKLSEYAPAIASADLDGNGFDDLVVGGDVYNHSQIFFQQKSGVFVQRDLLPASLPWIGEYRDEGIVLFDANGDGKPDVYVTSGGYNLAVGDKAYQDRLYINDGKGNFIHDAAAFPVNHTSKLCVRAIDFNKDGRLDLFVSGRVEPGQYPKPVSSFILRNDSEGGKAKFTDVTKEIAPDLLNIGLVCDALFTDFDGDGEMDLVLAGEWMPVTFLKNINGKFVNTTPASGIANQHGWWNSIVAGDFRHTGRMDYIVGNTGLNTLYRASEQYPVYITAKNFENTPIYMAIPSLFLPDANGVKKEFPAFGRDDMLRQMISLRKRYPDYKSFAAATMDDLITPEQRKGALRLDVNNSQSCFLRNDGNGKFTAIPLPRAAQVSALNGMVADDFDADGNLDVLINGNDFGSEISVGRYDALNGLLLKGDGKGGFSPLSILQSGIFIPGNGKGLVSLLSSSGDYLVAATQRLDALKVFELRKKIKSEAVNPSEISALISFKNGTTEKREFYYGSSFLSQSARFVMVNAAMASITFSDKDGSRRVIEF